jgi:hypothetical protein
MTLEDVQKEINQTRNELAKVPQIEARLHRLLGMEEILLLQEQEEKKPELKAVSK